jgi:hypothetical protein
MHGPVSLQRLKKKQLLSESIHQMGTMQKNLTFSLARSSRWLSCWCRWLHSLNMSMPLLTFGPIVLMTLSQHLHWVSYQADSCCRPRSVDCLPSLVGNKQSMAKADPSGVPRFAAKHLLHPVHFFSFSSPVAMHTCWHFIFAFHGNE